MSEFYLLVNLSSTPAQTQPIWAEAKVAIKTGNFLFFILLFFHHGNTPCTSSRKLIFCMQPQFDTTSPKNRTKFFLTKIFFWPNIFLTKIFFWPKIFLTKKFVIQNFFNPNFFDPKIFLTQKFFDQNYFLTQIKKKWKLLFLTKFF